jgi:hypothetical protein
MFPRITRPGDPSRGERLNTYMLQVRPDQIMDVYYPFEFFSTLKAVSVWRFLAFHATTIL